MMSLPPLGLAFFSCWIFLFWFGFFFCFPLILFSLSGLSYSSTSSLNDLCVVCNVNTEFHLYLTINQQGAKLNVKLTLLCCTTPQICLDHVYTFGAQFAFILLKICLLSFTFFCFKKCQELGVSPSKQVKQSVFCGWFHTQFPL